MLRLAHLALAATLAIAGCVTDPTEVVCRIDTDIPVDVPLTLRVTARQGGTDIQGMTADHVWQRGAVDGGIVPPATFALTPGPGEAHDGTVTLLIEAVTPDFTLRHLARFAFSPGRVTGLQLFLTTRCAVPLGLCSTVAAADCNVEIFCEENHQTCAPDGSCAPIMVVPTPGLPDGAVTDTPAPPGDATPTDSPVVQDVAPDAPTDGGGCGACAPPRVCTTAGACATCGPGHACCSDGSTCPTGQVCDVTEACVACGAAGAACCEGSTCSGSMSCSGGICQGCGAAAQACCTGTTCNAGLTCSSGTCHCLAIGTRCTATNMCCQPAVCQTLASDSLLHCCRVSGQTCATSHDCCGLLNCCNIHGGAGTCC